MYTQKKHTHTHSHTNRTLKNIAAHNTQKKVGKKQYTSHGIK